MHAEVLQYVGAADFLEPRWWNVGAAKLGGEDLNYLGVAGLRIAGGQGILIIAVCQVCFRVLSTDSGQNSEIQL
jgi:light-harvesting complex II chlorophyll a/b binding protein 7